MSAFGMPPENWAALQAIHGATDWINSVATKYTWFGSGYLSNTRGGSNKRGGWNFSSNLLSG